MKISWIKSQDDKQNFNFIEKLGMDVIKINNQEKIDKKIQELIEDEKKTIIITQELAGFSEDIIKKYSKCKDIKIIINKK